MAFLSAQSAYAELLLPPIASPFAVSGAAHVIPDEAFVNSAVQQLYLGVSINGNRIARLLPFTYRDNALWASPAVLHDIGFKDVGTGQSAIRVDSIAGTRVQYDAINQQVAIDAPLSQLDLARTIITTAGDAAPELTSSNGMLLNYDLYSTYNQAGVSLLSASSELRAFTAWGIASNTMLTQTGQGGSNDMGSPQAGWTHNVRLDTSWASSWPDQAITLTFGDTTMGNLAWTRPTRLGGIRLGRNFALQPYRTTAPLPAFIGSATMPSSVDLFIDGIKRYNGQVPAGPFQLNSLPTITGRGNAQVVLTDAMGRRTQIEIPFYASSRLLARGLSDWSLEAGYVRKDFGLSSFSYASDPVLGGTVRYGVTDNATVEAHVENTTDLTAGGMGIVTTLGALGQVSGSYAASRYGAQTGSQYGLGYQWQSRYFNIGASTVRARDAYRDVASLYGGAPPQVSESVTVGTSLAALGTISANYVRLHYPHEEPNRYAGVYWSKSLGSHATLSTSYNRNLNDGRDQSVFIGLSISLDHRVSTYSSVQRNKGEFSYGVGASQTVASDTGWGWSASGQRSPGYMSGNAQADYRGRYGEYRAGINAYDSTRSVYAGATGAVALMGGSVFAGRSVYDSFAVVSTQGVPDIPVKLQNNVVGKTDAKGMLMISPLNSYQKNLISIDPALLPVNVKIERVAIDVATADRSGTLVTFPIRPVRAASVIMNDGSGKPLPVGIEVLLAETGARSIVGYDGLVYFEDLVDRNTLKVSTEEYSCSVVFAYRNPGNTVAKIGPLRCG